MVFKIVISVLAEYEMKKLSNFMRVEEKVWENSSWNISKDIWPF